MAKVFVGVTTSASQYMPVQSCRLSDRVVLNIAAGQAAAPAFSIPNPEGKFWVICPIDVDMVWVNFDGTGANELGWPVFKGQPQHFEGSGTKKPSIFVPA